MARITKLVTFANGILMRDVNRIAVTHPHMNRRFLAVQTAIAEEQEHNHYHFQEPKQQHIKAANLKEDYPKDDREQSERRKMVMDLNWIPHPRTGIYYPQGQDWVMNDVRDNAASFGHGQTYWLRNIEGVEKPDPDIPSADHYLHSN